MRRNKSMVVGLISGLCCVACIGLYLAQVDERAASARAEALERYGGDQIEVCVAKRDIAAGEIIDEGAVEAKLWVAALLPEGAITSTTEVIGRQLGSSILKGEVVSEKRFGVASSSLEVPEGLVAVSVPARDVQAVGGALEAGMRADVYATGSSSTDKLVSQALILGTNATAEGFASSGSVSWVTLAVKPEAVEELVAAAQNLDLYFVLPTASLDSSAAESTSSASSGPSRSSSGAASGSGRSDVSSSSSTQGEIADTGLNSVSDQASSSSANSASSKEDAS